MAENADEDLFADLQVSLTRTTNLLLTTISYDGEDAEPDAAPPAPVPVKSESEAVVLPTDTPAKFSAPQRDEDEEEIKPFDPSAEDVQMDGVKQDYNANYGGYEMSERKEQVRLKDDG
jgi:hypothetical protein